MIVCKKAFLDGIPEQFKDWDKIHVTLEETGVTNTGWNELIPYVEYGKFMLFSNERVTKSR